MKSKEPNRLIPEIESKIAAFISRCGNSGITASLNEDSSGIKSKEENVSGVLKMYVDRFNADDDEHHSNAIPSSKALDFLS